MRKTSYILPSSWRQAVSAIAKTLTSRFGIISILLALLGVPSASLLAQAPTPVPVTTWRYDLAHTGQNTRETALTPANVNSTSFGKLFSHTVNGNMYAQPLYMPSLAMSDTKTHNVVFVATENDMVYAFDADSNGGANANAIWTANLASTAHGAAAGSTYITVDSSKLLSDILPNVGVTGTPVIDPATNTMYVVSATDENDQYVVRLHALNILSGVEQAHSPVEITATVAGTGTGSSGGQLTFDPYYDNQRPALSFYNGNVYIGFASHGDEGAYHGWLFSYNGTTLAQNDVVCLAPNGTSGGSGNGGGAGIWSAGAGLPIDTDGNAGAGRLFLVTGNGYYNGSTDWGESILDFDLTGGTLNFNASGTTKWFTSFNQAHLSQSDLDQGSGGLLMLPDQPGAHTHKLVQVGKEGRILVLDRDNLGGYAGAAAGSNTNILQDIPSKANGFSGGLTGGLWSTPAYWNGHVYMWPAQDHAKMFDLDPTTGALSTTPSSTGDDSSNNPGASFSISSNGTQDGIAWVVRSDGYTTHGPEVMYAYDATDLETVLYETDTNATRDNPGDAMKFSIPVVTNGKVYVISDGNYSGQLDVYGLLNGVTTTATPTFSPVGGSFTTAPQTVTITSTTPNAAIYYTLDGTTPTTGSTPYTAPLAISTNTTVNAIASAPGDLQSAVGTATFTFVGQTPTPSFNPVAGTYVGTQNVTIADTDPNSAIYYTTNGATPTASSTPYTAPIAVSASETIKAIAIDPNKSNSNVAVGPYVISAAGPTIDFSAGFANVTGLTLNGSAENNNDSRLELTDGGLEEAGSAFWNQPVGVGSFSTQFLFQLSSAVADGFTFTIQNVGRTALGGAAGALGYAPINRSVAIKFDLYNNATEGTDSTGLYINGASPTVPSVDMTSSGVVLTSGDGMLANVTYDGTTLTLVVTDGTTNNTFTHSWPINIPATVGANTAYVGFTAGTGGFTASQKILSWTYTDLSAPATTPTPTFTPAAGGYTGTQSVTIADTDANAKIYYTVDGTTPTASSTLYAAPITVSASETINAIAIDTAMTNSSVATAAYVISAVGVTPAPSFTPVAGTYATAQSVTITDTDANAKIYYTINGSTPTASSTLYAAPIAVSASETISAIAIDTALTNSSVATAAYVISGTAPAASFTVSGSAVSVTAGATTANTSTITVTPSGGFTGSVVLTAALTTSPAGAVHPPTFSFGATSPVSISGTTPATATLTISTTAATTSAGLAYPKEPAVPWYKVGGAAALACIFLFGIPSRRRAWRAMLGMLLLLLTAASGMLACGGSSGGGSNPITNPGTTAGAYTITVTATSGATVVTTPVQLTVQ